jgi:hypothetical protein
MRKKGINRRRFLQTSGLVIAGAAVVSSTGTMLLDPTGAWAISTTTLDEHTAMTLVQMCRYIYPHDAIGDTQYSKIVEEFDKKASTDSAFAQLLRDGVGSLDAGSHGKWLDVSDEDKLQALKSVETTPFFQTVRGTMVGATGFYNQPVVWRQLGYEGSSWQFGGYLNRGFDDIGWLPKE